MRIMMSEDDDVLEDYDEMRDYIEMDYNYQLPFVASRKAGLLHGLSVCPSVNKFKLVKKTFIVC